MEKLALTNAPLAPSPLGPGYAGPETYREATVAATTDGALMIGVWAYDGRLVSENAGEAHQAWLVLEGELTVEQGDERTAARAGELMLFEAPYGPKIVEASPDFRAVWIAAARSVA